MRDLGAAGQLKNDQCRFSSLSTLAKIGPMCSILQNFPPAADHSYWPPQIISSNALDKFQSMTNLLLLQHPESHSSEPANANDPFQTCTLSTSITATWIAAAAASNPGTSILTQRASDIGRQPTHQAHGKVLTEPKVVAATKSSKWLTRWMYRSSMCLYILALAVLLHPVASQNNTTTALAPTVLPTAVPTRPPTSQPTYLRFSSLDVDLSQLSSSPRRGVRIGGPSANARLGFSAASLGDFNGDGTQDLAVGAYNHSTSGMAYVLLSYGGSFSDMDLHTVTNTFSLPDILRLYGKQPGGQFGYSISSAGDFNHDGLADLIVGAWLEDVGPNSRAGAAYVIFGRAGPYNDIFLASFSSGSQGLRITGAAADDNAGSIVKDGGDINLDGCDDVIIGASGADAGVSYVVFGSATTPTADLVLGFNGQRGFAIIGVDTQSNSGTAVSSIGDFNVDGFPDIIVGARSASLNRGAAYIVFGHAAPFADVQLNFESSSIGRKILGGSPGDFLGHSVSFAGDVNGDNASDIIIGAYGAQQSPRAHAGIAYVIYGGANALPGALNLTTFVSGGQGFCIFGGVANDYLGQSVSNAGDVNGDGYGDLIVGAYRNAAQGRFDAGAAYVVYGAQQRGDVYVTGGGFLGFRIYGAAIGDLAGQLVSRMNDVNGDGLNDLVVGAHMADTNGGVNSGAVYIVYGFQISPSNRPTLRPSRHPTLRPTRVPSCCPSSHPSVQPTSTPSVQPVSRPTAQPTSPPSLQPSTQPSGQPVSNPSAQPSNQPTGQPSIAPTQSPSSQPSRQPTASPSSQPTSTPTRLPSSQPSSSPSAQPVRTPTARPSISPSSQPSSVPSLQPTSQPSRAPTAQPTIVPTGQPVSNPSAQPSNQPTGQPSIAPTHSPSSQPSRQPTASPSSQPTSTPTRQPSGQPSSSHSAQPVRTPTARPSMCPSRQPSSVPSVQPTSQPSRAPSAQPTIVPTGQPSRQPTEQPTLQPQCRPSSQPTGAPTSQPSRLPSSIPSVLPTGQPICLPSGQPSTQPSALPSAGPTASPTAIPSGYPTSQPSANLTSQPSRIPTVLPSTQPSSAPSIPPLSMPSVAPTTQPSTEPSSRPSGLPSSWPSGLPTSYPTGQPTAEPSRAPTAELSVQPSAEPSAYPSRQPSTQPTGQPSTQPSAQPFQSPTAQPSSIPTANYNTTVEFSHRPAPNITSLVIASVNRTTLWVIATVQGQVDAVVHCGAFWPATRRPASVNEIITQNALAYTKNGVASVQLRSLVPATSYAVYCATASLQGHAMSYAAALRTVAPAQTLCCKTVTVSVLVPSLTEGSSVDSVISVTVDVPPSDSATLIVSTTGLGGATVFPATSTLAISDRASTVRNYRISAGIVSVGEVAVQLSGPSAAEYSVVFTSAKVLRVHGAEAEPPVPMVRSARFSDEGTAVIITFDSPTDQGGYRNTFPCSAFLSFPGFMTASCQWVDSSNMAVFPRYASASAAEVLSVGSSVTVLPSTIKAQCTSTVVTCVGWQSVASNQLRVLAPLSPPIPVVSISVPASVSACSSLRIDLTSSTGNAGRPWASTTFQVLTSAGETSAATQLQRYLAANFTFSPPTPVPPSALVSGFVYSIKATMCNFLGGCASTVRTVSVLASETLVPVTSIVGQNQRFVYRSAGLTVSSVSYTQDCASSVSYNNIKFEWEVTTFSTSGAAVPTNLRSTSQSPGVLRLVPFALDAGKRYTVQLTTTSTVSSLKSTASISVIVLQGGVVASIFQGTAVSVRSGYSITLDASASYDEDVAGKTGSSAGLSFSWSCVQLLPAFSTNCSNLNLAEVAAEKNTVTAVSSAIASTSRVTVIASSGDRSSSAYTDVAVTEMMHGEIRIANTASSVTSVDTSQKLTLLGRIKTYEPCNATWNIDDSIYDLSQVSLTQPRKLLNPLSPPGFTAFNLVISGHALVQRASLLFTLSCGGARTSIVVTTNGAPLPGEFLVTPPEGTELRTLFHFSAVQWSDSDLPLTYQFGFSSRESLSNLVIVSASELTFAVTTLPAGAAVRDYVLDCSLYVFDKLGAVSTELANVTVHALGREEKNQQMSSLLSSSSSGSVDDTKRVVSIVSSVLNKADCSAAPNCTVLNRLPCSKTNGVCGVCIAGHVGDAGDSNHACVPVASLISPDINKGCSQNTDCLHGQACDASSGLCAFPNKACQANCSGRGSCVFTELTTDRVRSKCTVDDTTCEASCTCVRPYTGRGCEISLDTLRTNREFRSQLIAALLNLTRTEDVTIRAVKDWSASLYSLALNPYELSETDIERVVDIASTTLARALEVGVADIGSMLGILQATDTAASVRKQNYNPNDYQDLSEGGALVYRNNSAAGILTVATAFADVITRSTVPGERVTTILYDNFRLSAELHSLSSVGEKVAISAPQTDAEVLTAVSPPTAVLTPSSSIVGESTLAVQVIAVHPQAYTSDTQDFLSSPLYLQLTASDGRSAAGALTTVEFSFQHNSAIAELAHPTAANFTSRCRGDSPRGENYTYECPGSGVLLHNNCSRGAGVYTQYCPALHPACAKLGLQSGDIDILSSCVVTSFNETYTNCRCSVDGTRRQRQRGYLTTTTEETLLDESGVTNMIVTSTYLGMEFADTFNAADTFNDPNAVLVVIYMFSALWGAGLLLLTACLSRSYLTKREKRKMLSNKVAVAAEKLQDGSAIAEARQCLMSYIESVIPSVYGGNKSSFGRMLGELRAHHRYLTLFTLGDGEVSVYGKSLLIGKLLTVETMQMFVLAVLYDLEGPEDDGSCKYELTQDSCLERRALLDDSQAYCQWTNDQCSFNRQTFTIKSFVYILILTSIFTSVISTPLDYLFKVCSAPLIADALQDQVSASERHTRRRSSLLQGVRRVSAVTTEALQAARRQSLNAATAARGFVKERVSWIGSWMGNAAVPGKVIANRDISEDIEHLHHQAVAVLPSVSINADSLRRKRHSAALTMKNRALSRRAASSQRFGAAPSAGDMPADATIYPEKVDNERAASVTSTEREEIAKSAAARTSLDLLCDEIIAQRELLPRDSVFTQVFDAQWGVEAELFSVSSGAGPEVQLVRYGVSKEAQAAIYEDILTSDAEAKELTETIPQYTVQHGGFAILNMFLLDLLGRTTYAARIFKNKFEEDFEETKAVSRWFQSFAALVLLACNAFFIYYSLLKAFQKGKTWQYQYLKGCVAQILVETLLNETLECLWLNYCVPDLVRKEVKKATLVINQVVDQITTAASGSSGRSILFLDATAYLFASTKVAKAHPTLLESIVVLHYQSHLPGELSRAWPHCKRKADNEVIVIERSSALGRVFRFVPDFILSVSITVVLMMQLLGTMSFSFQRVVIRFVQPLLLSGLTLMWLFASDSQVGMIITITGSAVLFAAFCWRQYYVYTKEQEEAQRIAADDVLQTESDVEQDIESLPPSEQSTPMKPDSAAAESKITEPENDNELPESERNAASQKGCSFFGSSSGSEKDEDVQQGVRRVPFAAENSKATDTQPVPVASTSTIALSKATPSKAEELFRFFDSSSDGASSAISRPSANHEEKVRAALRAEGLALGFNVSKNFSVSKLFGSSDSEDIPGELDNVVDSRVAMQATRKAPFFGTDSDKERTADGLDYPHADEPEPVQGNRGKAFSFFDDSDEDGIVAATGWQDPALRSEMEAEVDGPWSFLGSSSDDLGDDEDPF